MSLLHYPGEEFQLGRKKLEERGGRKGEVVFPVPVSMVLSPGSGEGAGSTVVLGSCWRLAGSCWRPPEHRLLPGHRLPPEHHPLARG